MGEPNFDEESVQILKGSYKVKKIFFERIYIGFVVNLTTTLLSIPQSSSTHEIVYETSDNHRHEDVNESRVILISGKNPAYCQI